MTTRPREALQWPFARHLADALLKELEPYCDRIEVAGSVRRRKDMVKDIELVVVPKMLEPEKDLFGEIKAQRDALTEYLLAEIARKPGVWHYRPNVKGITTFGVQNKFLLRTVESFWVPGETIDVAIDLFTASQENWGRDLAIRTGPAKLNQAVATLAQRKGWAMHAYGEHAFTVSSVTVLHCPEELGFFGAVNVECLPPEQRTDEWAESLMRERA